MPWQDSATIVVVVVCVDRHGWSAMQQHHHLQSAAWTGNQTALSADRNQQCETSFAALQSHFNNHKPYLPATVFRGAPGSAGSPLVSFSNWSRWKPMKIWGTGFLRADVLPVTQPKCRTTESTDPYNGKSPKSPSHHHPTPDSRGIGSCFLYASSPDTERDRHPLNGQSGLKWSN